MKRNTYQCANFFNSFFVMKSINIQPAQISFAQQSRYFLCSFNAKLTHLLLIEIHRCDGYMLSFLLPAKNQGIGRQTNIFFLFTGITRHVF